MRYYDIKFTRPTTANTSVSLPYFTTLDSYGNTIAGALDIQLDLLMTTVEATPAMSSLRVWGAGLQYLGPASGIVGSTIEIRAGMSKGLPLAKPTQRGLLLRGTVYQAYGNWQGTEQTLDLVITLDVGSASSTMNIPWVWLKGTSLKESLSTALKTANPDIKNVVFSLVDDIIAPRDDVGHYQTLIAFMQHIKSVTATPSYNGVKMLVRDNSYIVFDSGYNQSNPTVLDLVDFVGQPTWSSYATITLKLVMRGDLNIGDYITFPKTIPQLLTPNSYANYRDSSLFQGTYQIASVRHVGSFRQADADAWVTVVEAIVTGG